MSRRTNDHGYQKDELNIHDCAKQSGREQGIPHGRERHGNQKEELRPLNHFFLSIKFFITDFHRLLLMITDDIGNDVKERID